MIRYFFVVPTFFIFTSKDFGVSLLLIQVPCIRNLGQRFLSFTFPVLSCNSGAALNKSFFASSSASEVRNDTWFAFFFFENQSSCTSFFGSQKDKVTLLKFEKNMYFALQAWEVWGVLYPTNSPDFELQASSSLSANGLALRWLSAVSELLPMLPTLRVNRAAEKAITRTRSVCRPMKIKRERKPFVG